MRIRALLVNERLSASADQALAQSAQRLPGLQREVTGEERYAMTAWNPEQLEKIGSTDDFHISPYRNDGTTPGTPTWIWSVVVDGNVYAPTTAPRLDGTGQR
jgi:hypothetical protein